MTKETAYKQSILLKHFNNLLRMKFIGVVVDGTLGKMIPKNSKNDSNDSCEFFWNF